MVLSVDNLYTERYNHHRQKKQRSQGGAFMDNRTLLLQCAKELFYSRGYDAVGVQEIVDRAGLTKPTLYYYFGNKIGLLKTLLETKFEDLRVNLRKSIDQGGGIREILYRLGKAYCKFFESDREFYMLMMSLFYSARENEAYRVIKPYVTEFYDTIVNVFYQEAHELGNMNGREKQFAIGFIGTVNHYLLLHCEMDPSEQERISEQQIISLVNQYMYGIFT